MGFIANIFHFKHFALLLVGTYLITYSSVGLSDENPPPLPHPQSMDVSKARELKARQLQLSPFEVAEQTSIDENYKELIVWMRNDLRNYFKHFEAIFKSKLERIRRHQMQREQDRDAILTQIKSQFQSRKDEGNDQELLRLEELHKPHGFIAEYSNAADFIGKFVGPKGKLLKTAPTDYESKQMNRRGAKQLYVDTWAVPFFNTGTQTLEEARRGVGEALREFETINVKDSISLLRFTELMALYARPEFNDVRRYKLLPFPREDLIWRFGGERSDARTFGDRYPVEVPVVINKLVDIGPVSFIFGQRVHLFGLISHSLSDNTADGRIFTGPADFLEHDYAHAFFNLMPAIPGTPEDWFDVHRKYFEIRDQERNPQVRRMIRLVYYHFTHESGFRVLVPDAQGNIDETAYSNELNVIKELIKTRYHYDFIIKDGHFPDGYEAPLEIAFGIVSPFFRTHFNRIADLDRERNQLRCRLVFTDPSKK